MASFSALPASLLSLSILIAAAAAAVSGSPEEKKADHLHFYFHEIFQGAPNATSFVVAGLGPNSSSSSPFGNIVVFDNALRTGREPGSAIIGRAQGMAVAASLADRAVLTTINLVFTAGEHRGSTLALVGRVDASGLAERTVVGGSGEFRMARGYAISNLVDSISASYIVVEFDVYVTH